MKNIAKSLLTLAASVAIGLAYAGGALADGPKEIAEEFEVLPRRTMTESP